MIQPATASALIPRGAGPSLYKLLGNIPDARRWRQPADVLIVLNRQLEHMAQEQGHTVNLALGTMRFSLFRLHQARIAQLAPLCHSVVVYGEADAEPPALPNVQFVPVAKGTALSQEWFLVADSPTFWGALIAHPLADRSGGAERRVLFDGVMTADDRIVSRANLLLSLARGVAAPAIVERDSIANHATWARIAYALATHPEHERHNLLSCLAELPAFHSLLSEPSRAIELLLPRVLDVLRQYYASAGEIIYRYDGSQLLPFAWSGDQPPAQPAHEGIAGQALSQRHLAMMPLTPSDPEQALLPEAQSVAAMPLFRAGVPWGVLLVGQADPDPEGSPTASGVVGVASILDQLLQDQAPSAPVFSGPAVTAPPPVAPSPPPSVPWAGGAPAWASAAPPRPAPATPAAAPPPTSAWADAAPPTATWAGAAPPPWAGAAPVAPSATAPAADSADATSGFGLPSWMRPASGARPGSLAPTHAATPLSTEAHPSWSVFRQRLLTALVAYNQTVAEQVWSEVCAHYPPEAICVELLAPLQIDVGEGWHRGEITVASEHFASRFVQTKLLNLFNASAETAAGSLAIVCCAQGELHEIGAIMLSLFLRWNGFRVVYLGQNVPNSTIEDMVEQLRPQALVLSASTVQAANNLIEVGNMLDQFAPPRPVFVYGGRAFYDRPELQARIPSGTFLKGALRQVVNQIAELIRTA